MKTKTSILFFPFHRWQSKDSERCCYLPEVTQLVCGLEGFESRSVGLWSSCTFYLAIFSQFQEISEIAKNKFILSSFILQSCIIDHFGYYGRLNNAPPRYVHGLISQTLNVSFMWQNGPVHMGPTQRSWDRKLMPDFAGGSPVLTKGPGGVRGWGGDGTVKVRWGEAGKRLWARKVDSLW